MCRVLATMFKRCSPLSKFTVRSELLVTLSSSSSTVTCHLCYVTLGGLSTASACQTILLTEA